MAVPFFGFILGLISFSLLGIIVLRVSGVAPIRPLTVGAFVAAAFVSVLAYAVVYGQVFGQGGHLRSRATATGFLIGVPVIAAIAGTLASRFIVRIVLRNDTSVRVSRRSAT